MSGQPVNSQAKANEKRNEYMETLALQAQNNDINLQANKNYLLSGILPAVSQMKDTRTTSEKLADIEKMKQGVVDDLKGLYDPSVSLSIVNGVLASPLNIDNKLFNFFVQNLPELAKIMKKKFKYGIQGDANDVSTFVNIIEGYYNRNMDSVISAKSFFDSGTSFDNKNKLMDKNDFSRLKTELGNISRNLATVKGGVIDDRMLNILLTKITYIESNIPSNELINTSANMALNDEFQMTNEFGLTVLTKELRKLPSLKSIYSLIRLIERAVEMQNLRQIEQIIINLDGIFTPLYNFFTENPLNNLIGDAQNKLDQNKHLESIQRRDAIMNEQNIRNQSNNAQKVLIVNPYENPAYVKLAGDLNPQNLYSLSSRTPSESSEQFGIKKIINDNINDILEYLNERKEREELGTLPDSFSSRTPSESSEQFGIKKIINDNINDILEYLNERKEREELGTLPDSFSSRTPSESFSLSSKGDGLRKKRRGRPKGSGLVKEKPKSVKVPNYVGFGINEINQKNLTGNILTIRRKNHSNYRDMPSKMISPNLQRVLKSIVGGSVPNYDDVKGLNEEEQNYLHKVLSKSNLADKFSVPAPSKDKREKDIHSFEVMKGEIMSGNDSKDLVKKFKLLIIKLSREGTLPRNEVNDLLTTLVDLGY